MNNSISFKIREITALTNMYAQLHMHTYTVVHTHTHTHTHTWWMSINTHKSTNILHFYQPTYEEWFQHVLLALILA